MTRVPRRIAVAVCLSLLAACATNPATGRRQVMLVSEAQAASSVG